MLDEEESIKVIVVGDGNVGKTSLLHRFVKGYFIDQYRKTIGAEFMEMDVFLRSTNSTVRLMLWDTAGQEVFNALTQAYYRGAGAAILAFSSVDRDSFMSVSAWKQRVESVCGPITMVLCQTKFDLSHEAVITNAEAEKLANQLEVPLFRVSTKDDFNVTQLFEFAAQRCVASATQDETTEEQADDVGNVGRLNETEESTAKVSAAAASSMAPGKQHGDGGAVTAHAPSTAAAFPSPPAARKSKACGPDAIEEATRTACNSSGGWKEEEKPSSRAKSTVILMDRKGKTHHKKKSLKCLLY
ncbi:small G-protein, putative [Leishmania panamensis]|uniref:Small G-protein, putative n=3 Tax=Leishmania guyanensis species complex TaxID=38579 RepID=A0A088S539_LEIPA|nr:small G-protein, putative [Leishmania panamensis]AIO02770.1 small G-protein, putative [Leishmania panamensis]CCM19882.1 small G-protein, putative [Leishmania guyanensis]